MGVHTNAHICLKHGQINGPTDPLYTFRYNEGSLYHSQQGSTGLDGVGTTVQRFGLRLYLF